MYCIMYDGHRHRIKMAFSHRAFGIPARMLFNNPEGQNPERMFANSSVHVCAVVFIEGAG